MLSYRKSQQVLLTEKLKMKNVIHVFGASGSGTTMARLCLSAFARVATRIFSAGAASCASLPQRIRAGCDHPSQCNRHGNVFLCHSAFVRVATYSKTLGWMSIQLCHSAFVRAATCDCALFVASFVFATAHSCGLRLRKSNAAHCEFAARR